MMEVVHTSACLRAGAWVNASHLTSLDRCRPVPDVCGWYGNV